MREISKRTMHLSEPCSSWVIVNILAVTATNSCTPINKPRNIALKNSMGMQSSRILRGSFEGVFGCKSKTRCWRKVSSPDVSCGKLVVHVYSFIGNWGPCSIRSKNPYILQARYQEQVEQGIRKPKAFASRNNGQFVSALWKLTVDCCFLVIRYQIRSLSSRSPRSCCMLTYFHLRLRISSKGRVMCPKDIGVMYMGSASHTVKWSYGWGPRGPSMSGDAVKIEGEHESNSNRTRCK